MVGRYEGIGSGKELGMPLMRFFVSNHMEVIERPPARLRLAKLWNEINLVTVFAEAGYVCFEYLEPYHSAKIAKRC
ncbi:hypothetical protein OZ411_36410 [Bradyrhizobium sp. Arg237L]|uniref:hypothetical protein n=1 Tax=Bradyrhizobium sp. Arg237L TaxID=3003352 RepID=UPI00249F8753|nr:hypothetical protein [Bradyrhizobium sp. Arg237L]MDI4238298.1 hypothetical protein [Bradyrhizobium sp. Arg237L]